MINQLRKTEKFAHWMDNLRDIRARARIQVRLDYGAGYRVYYTYQKQAIIFLLIGGDKSTQQADIDMAQQLAKQLEN